MMRESYLQWLSLETGKTYRLPSEAEYEYVARAGDNGTYWWGEDSPAEAVENLTGERDKSPAKRQWSTYFKKYGDGHWGPAPAGSLSSDALVHPMGVHDIAGNVSRVDGGLLASELCQGTIGRFSLVQPRLLTTGRAGRLLGQCARKKPGSVPVSRQS